MKRIPGYQYYAVNIDGDVFSLKGKQAFKLKQRVDHHGYKRVTLHETKTAESVQVHTLVCRAFLGTRPPGMVCRHMDGNSLNNKASNLMYGTPKQNFDDSVRHGTSISLLIGEKHPVSKLTDEQALEVERRARGGEKQIDIAKAFGISQRHVSDLKRRRTRHHLWGRGGKIATTLHLQ